MEKLNQPVRLQNLIRKHEIAEYFDTKDLSFSLLRFAKGEQIFTPGEPAGELLFLIRGTLRIYSIGPDGELTPVGLRTPPAMMGETDFITGRPAPFYVEAKTEVLCIGLSLARYGAMLHKDIRFLNYLLVYMADNTNRRAVMETSHRALKDRILFYLKSEASDSAITGVNDAVMRFHCSRRQLQRVLAQLQEEGMIEKKKKGHYTLV